MATLVQRLTTPRGLLGAGLAIGLLFLFLGYPKARPDDLFFVGAGLELSRTGELSNPLIQGWIAQFHTQSYYVQPPFYPYAIAGWVKAFGISSLSLRAFQIMAQVVGTFFWCLFLRRLGLRGAMLLVWLVLGTTGDLTGMRPERWTAALMNLGLFLLAGRTLLQAGAAGLCLGLAVGTYPGVISSALPLALAALAAGTWNRGTGTLAAAFAVALGGIAISVVLFGWAIGWHVAEFTRVFGLHTALRRPPLVEGIGIFLHSFVQYWQWLLVLPAFLLSAAIAAVAIVRRPKLPAGEVNPLLFVIAALLASVAIGVVVYPISAGGLCVGVVSTVAMLSLSLDPGPKGARYRWTALAVMVSLSWVLNFRGIFMNLSESRAGVSPETAAAWRARAEAAPVCVVDAYAAQYVFDYKLPANARDWMYYNPPPTYGWPQKWNPEERQVWVGEREFLSQVPGSPVPPLTPGDYFRIGSKRLGVPKRLEIVCIGGDETPSASAGSAAGGKP